MTILVEKLTAVGQQLAAMQISRPNTQLRPAGRSPANHRTTGTRIIARSSVLSANASDSATFQPSGVGHLERASAAIQGQNVLEALAIAVGKKTTAWSVCKGSVAAARGSL